VIMIVSAHVFAHVTHVLVRICHHRSVSPERDMRPRSRSPVSGRQLALLPGSRAMTCPCDPCPWCTLRLPHDSHIDDVNLKLRNQMLQWAENGCSVFQLTLAVVSYEWILKHHEQRPYGPFQETFEIAPIPGHPKLCGEYGNVDPCAATSSSGTTSKRLVLGFGQCGRHSFSVAMVGCDTSRLCWQSCCPVKRLG
jgi:hypothetical protein